LALLFRQSFENRSIQSCFPFKTSDVKNRGTKVKKLSGSLCDIASLLDNEYLGLQMGLLDFLTHYNDNSTNAQWIRDCD